MSDRQTTPDGWTRVRATVRPGYRVASGQSDDPRFPGGSLAMQTPHFLAGGIDLRRFHRGTLNLSIAPKSYRVVRAKATFRDVRWHPTEPPEHFSFFDCRVIADDGAIHDGLVYYPHPETKPDHVQPDDVLEVLTDRIEGLAYGSELWLELPPTQLEIR